MSEITFVKFIAGYLIFSVVLETVYLKKINFLTVRVLFRNAVDFFASSFYIQETG